MDAPLLIRDILVYAEQHWPAQEILSVMPSGQLDNKSYTDIFKRCRHLANALQELGVQASDRIATLAWNDHRHVEIYFAVACSGAVCHTINPRLSEEQIHYIINHADDRWLFTAPDFVPLIEKLLPSLPRLKGVIVLSDSENIQPTALPDALDYETLLLNTSDSFIWPDFPETTASSLCYTSGTTGHPKGVLYSHRSTVLHTLMCNQAGVVGLTSADTVMPVVPMFHVNAWGVPYTATLAGARLVLPGPHMGNGELLQRLIEEEQVTVAFGVPTIWLALVHYLEESGKRIDSLQRIYTGGTACPRHIMEILLNRYGVRTIHLWGMTELSPLGTMNMAAFRPDLDTDNSLDLLRKQGRSVFGLEMRLKDDDGLPVEQNGTDPGRLFVRGYATCSGYYRNEGLDSEDHPPTHDGDGWLDTGDIGTIDEDGYLQITDRAKDVIKSGGEWISSIELENLAMGHPDIVEAAVIACPDEQWQERPLLVAVRKTKDSPSAKELGEWYQNKLPDWMHPDRIVFVEELPHTATGKVKKSQLRNELEQLLAQSESIRPA